MTPEPTDPAADPIAVLLRRSRLAAKRTQADVAAAAGVHRVTLARWEAGKAVPTLPQTRAWAAALDHSLALLPALPAANLTTSEG